MSKFEANTVIEGEAEPFIWMIQNNLAYAVKALGLLQVRLLNWKVEKVSDVEAIQSDLMNLRYHIDLALDECSKTLKGTE